MVEKQLQPLQWIAGASKRTTCVRGCSMAKGKRVAWDPNVERFLCETHGLERDTEIKAQLASQSSVAGTGGASPGKMALGPSTGESRPPPQATEASLSPTVPQAKGIQAGQVGESKSSSRGSGNQEPQKGEHTVGGSAGSDNPTTDQSRSHRPVGASEDTSKSSEPGKGTSAPAATETAGGTGARAGPTPLPAVPKGSEVPAPTPVVSVVLMGPDAIASLKQIVGPTRAYSFVAIGARTDPLRIEQGDYNLEGESAEESLERVSNIAKQRFIKLQAEMRGGSP